MWLCVLRNSETTWPISSKDLTLSDSKTASNMCDEVYSSPPVFFLDCCALVTWAVAKDHLEKIELEHQTYINIFETLVTGATSQLLMLSFLQEAPWAICSMACLPCAGGHAMLHASNFLKLMVFWPHVIANGVMARSDEPHSPLQVTAVQENIQN